MLSDGWWDYREVMRDLADADERRYAQRHGLAAPPDERYQAGRPLSELQQISHWTFPETMPYESAYQESGGIVCHLTWRKQDGV